MEALLQSGLGREIHHFKGEFFMETTVVNQIINGMKSLGCKGKVSLKRVDSYVIAVMLNGKTFGLWSVEKATFVA
jgi:hypothetical protein